ncbi:hypothetical protein LOD99_13250 [Oopsacas minuta]|uniref:Extradiol ring-cleavage dioxygenase class III enzyme subunit B domain-containing protein n=1 Tax=Oopsacas minuta TaxID=111878 RepID=A0AAV7JB99_9METZ|nr:hypothetical protein LOD99_13250 [Oopsacas minuta]
MKNSSYLILPHGAMIFNGIHSCDVSEVAAKRIQEFPQQLRYDCNELYNSCIKAVKIVAESKPDLIILNTPHGISLTDSIGVYVNGQAKGNAEWNQNWSEFEVDIHLDSNIANLLVEHLRKDGIPTEGISAFSRTEIPLRWGEVIPIWFLKEITKIGVKVVIFSNPIHFVKGLAPVSERVQIGRSIGKFIRNLPHKVLYVVSGDLAHTHKTDCELPLYLPDPRWEIPLPADERVPLDFDIAVENWIKGIPFTQDVFSTPIKSIEEIITTWDVHVAKDAENWLVKATKLKGQALSCGIYGFGILHGLLISEIELGTRFQVNFLCRLAPTYYGMMVAAIVVEK